MTQNCLPIVNWLKNWFTPKDEDYQYNITASNYNPNIDSSITITVTVTDGDDNLVDNHSFTLDANGTDVSLTTTNGVATYSYTCSNWGLATFSVNNSNTQINVTGWRKYSHNSESLYTVHYNQDFVRLIVHLSSKVNVSSSWNGWQNILTDDFIRPSNGIVRIDNSGQVLIRVSNGSENIKFKSVLNNTLSTTVFGEIIWKRKA